MSDKVVFKSRQGLTVTLYHGDCLELLPNMPHVDAVITDPPFSERTHRGHDVGIIGANKKGHEFRNTLGYSAWTDEHVYRVCRNLPSSGWACFITDHTLAYCWERELKSVGRYVFAPIPCFTRGRTVRISGDGPSSWTDWMIVSRTTSEAKWGTLPGIYEGNKGGIQHMGGKPLNMMCRIVEDYSRERSTVLDICCGSGTTGIACLRTGRNFIGIELDEKHFKTACDRIQKEIDAQLL